jgi:hypothetical protein
MQGQERLLHRRRFLALAGAMAGGTILAACGGSAATDPPKPAAATSAPTAAPTTAPTTAAGSAGATRPAGSATAASTTAASGVTTGTPAAGGQILAIEAYDFGYRTMGSIPGGLTRVQLKNTGKEDHHAQFMLLNTGVTPEQLGAAFAKGPERLEDVFKLVTFVGGPGAIAPGGTTEVMLSLKEGQYLLACFVEGADHLPHLAKGMLLPLKVTAAAAATAPAPQVNGTINLVDFNFDMPTTLPAGKSMWRVTNTGAQVHEMSIMQLPPGKTVDDVKRFFDAPPTAPPSGPPPVTFMGGMQALTRGNEGIMVLDLKAGDYVATCLIPDQSQPNGDSHLHLGMIKGLTVK